MTPRAAGVRQHDESDCGAACLASIAAAYCCRLPIARIRQHASTDARGTTVLGLVQAASALGFTAKGVRAPFESVARVPLPAIAHLKLESGLLHYVVVAAVGGRHVEVMDPQDGRRQRWTHEQFTARWTGVLVLMVPAATFRERDDRVPRAGRLWRIVRPHRAVMLESLVGAALFTLLGLSTSVYVQKIVDFVLVDGNTNLLNLLGTIMLALLAAQAAIGAMKSVLTMRTGQRIDGALILGYYRHLLTLPQAFFDTMRVGEITSRIGDAVKIRAFINDVAADLVVNALTVAFSLALLVLYSPRLGALVLGSVPLYAAVYYATNRVNRSNSRAMMERGAQLQAHLVESLNAMATIKRFGLEPSAGRKTETRFVRVLRSVYRAGLTATASSAATEVIARASTIALLWVGARAVIAHALTPGELMSCYALLGYLTGPAVALVGANRTAQDAAIAADRLFEIMDLERESAGAVQIALPREAVGAIRLVNVQFGYRARAPLFSDLSLTIPRGSLTAIVGESGSGKSSLVSLLQRLYPVERGRIYVGEHDLAHVSTECLRELIGVVPQRIDLFDGDVLENVAPGEPEPDVRRVLEICQALGVTEFVERLPQGFATHLGENGALLSGGERQRLAIARALYRRPEVLILDEATSSLDSRSEEYVRRAIDSLNDAGKTVVVIAHRLSTVMRADQIVVLERGTVAEQGRHEELLRHRGRYFDLWRRQVPESVAHLSAAGAA